MPHLENLPADEGGEEDLDLDALLAEGLLIKAAQRNKALGRKNKPEEARALKAAEIVANFEAWETVATYAVFHEQRWADCEAHPAQLSYIGDFEFQRKVRGIAARRLSKLPTTKTPGVEGSYTIDLPPVPCPTCWHEKLPIMGLSANLPIDLLEHIK